MMGTDISFWMGAGADCSADSELVGFTASKILACLTLAKLLNISAFLLNAVWAATAELEIGMAPLVRRCSGKINLNSPPSRRRSATSVYYT